MAKTYFTKTELVEHRTDERTIQLAREYTEKLQNIIESLIENLDGIEVAENTNRMPSVNYRKLRYLFDKTKKILPITADLAQAISQRIEHGSLEILAKLESRLVLAEFETAISTAERLLLDDRLKILLAKRLY